MVPDDLGNDEVEELLGEGGVEIGLERERVQIAHLRSLAEAAQLDPAFAEKFLNFIVAEVIRHHEDIRG